MFFNKDFYVYSERALSLKLSFVLYTGLFVYKRITFDFK